MLAGLFFCLRTGCGAQDPYREGFMSLQQAPAHVVLAVDLIELLENNRIPAATVLAALPLLQQDYQRKLAQEQAADPTGTDLADHSLKPEACEQTE
jgi:Protein of unknown function (DUF2496).